LVENIKISLHHSSPSISFCKFCMHLMQLKSSYDPSCLTIIKHLVSGWSGCVPTLKCLRFVTFLSFLSWYYNNSSSIELYGSFNGAPFSERARMVLKIFFNWFMSLYLLFKIYIIDFKYSLIVENNFFLFFSKFT